ncbi:MAG: glycosyltransferase [Bacteroidota bacterium]
MYADHQPTADELLTFYSDYDEYLSTQWEQGEREFNEQVAGVIAGFLQDGTCLDIGCGYGLFLDEMRKLGFGVFGVEQAPGAVRYARKNGTEVFLGPVEQYFKQHAQVFRVITILNVLEHTKQPREILRQIYERLEEGGILVICVPDCQVQLILGNVRKLFGIGDPFLIDNSGRLPLAAINPPHHLVSFTPYVLRDILHQLGFTVVDIRHAPVVFNKGKPIRNILKRLAEISSDVLRFVSFSTVHLGYSTLCVAQKPKSKYAVTDARIVSHCLPKISIITPSFNQGKFLEETILSVLNQNYPNLEYIIVDGGSTDNSVQIIRKYEKHLAYWVSEKDRGQSHAVNKGLAKATGEIIGWLNSDDTYLPGTLTRIIEAFQRYPEFEVVYGDQVLTDQNGNWLRIKHELPYNYHRLCYHSYQSQPATFLKRSVIEKVGGLEEKLYYSMDYEFFLRIGRECLVRHVRHLFAAYRLHSLGKSASHGEARHLDERKAVLQKYRPKYSSIVLINKLIQAFWQAFYNMVRVALVFRDNPLSYVRYRTFKSRSKPHVNS